MGSYRLTCPCAFFCCVYIPAVVCVCLRLRPLAESYAWVSCWGKDSQGVKTSIPFCLLFHSVAMLWCWFLCASLFSLWLHSDWDVSHSSCPNRPPLVFLSLCVLIGPGLLLPMDAAPPTTAQCIQPAAPRDCPRTSLSLFPLSSSLVRRGREENGYRWKRRSLKYKEE